MGTTDLKETKETMRLAENGEFKKGDLVKITKAGENADLGFFRGGHKCRLLYWDTEEFRWRANFNNKGNASVNGNGLWWVGDDPRGTAIPAAFTLVSRPSAEPPMAVPVPR